LQFKEKNFLSFITIFGTLFVPYSRGNWDITALTSVSAVEQQGQNVRWPLAWFSPPQHTHPFNGPFFVTTQVSRYQKGKTNLDFTEARDSEWQWQQLGHMQVCTSL